MLNRLLAGLCAGAAVTAGCLPVSAAVDNNLPIRWNTGAAVWSTNQDAVDTFLKTGEVTDRGLAGGISRSGWTADELRAGITKSYSVDFVGVSRFLYSDAGVKFLKVQSRSYFPYWTRPLECQFTVYFIYFEIKFRRDEKISARFSCPRNAMKLSWKPVRISTWQSDLCDTIGNI